MDTEVRQRRPDSRNGPEGYRSKEDHTGFKMLAAPPIARKIFVVFICLVGTFTMLICYQTLVSRFEHKTGTLDHFAKHVGIHRDKFAVIIDAGSTGSRVFACSFHESIIDGSIKLDDSLFVQNKPGLSAFSTNPKTGAQKVQELLDKAKAFVPEKEWQYTPLALRATAGLRLLPQREAEALLDEVRVVIDNSGFLTSDNSVAIMDGMDEGLYAWFTVNFLMDRIFGSLDKTVATLDLGGGSTQITFVPSDPSEIKRDAPSFLEQISVLRRNISIYSHSYLGLGLMTARKEVLSHGHGQDETEFHSECINPIIKRATWQFGGTTYTVSGPKDPLVLKKKSHGGGFDSIPVVRMRECNKIVHEYVKSKNVHRPRELLNRDITVFSYFYDRAIEFGIIDYVESGTATVKDFQRAAETACHNPNTEQPFMCLDLTFISVLFVEGYGFEPQTKLTLLDKIDGQEVSWSLGAAFSILQNGL